MYTARSSRNRNNCNTLFEKGEGFYFYVFDTETTGLDPKCDYIVQLSALKYNIKDHAPVLLEEFDIYMRPPFLMDEEVISKHGITNEFLEDKPSEDKVFDKIKKFFGNQSILVAYNGTFDINMMNALYHRQGCEFKYQVMLDVLDMARDLVTDSDKYNLETIAKKYGLDEDIKFHCSLDDCRATARLLFTFYNEYKQQGNPNIKKETIIVNYSYYWKGFNKSQTGIYFDTNFGRIWLNTVSKRWCSTVADLNLLDIDSFEKGICQKAGLSFNELAKLTPKKFEALKKERKI